MVRSALEQRLLIVMVFILLLTGCRDSNDQQSGDEATTSMSKIRAELTKTKRQQNELKIELQAVENVRDELEKEVAQITAERNNALQAATMAEQKIKELSAQLRELSENITDLEKALKEQNTIIESQQTTISEQQAVIAEQQAIITEQEATIVALEKIAQEQMAGEEQPQEEIPEMEPEVEEQQ